MLPWISQHGEESGLRKLRCSNVSQRSKQLFSGNIIFSGHLDHHKWKKNVAWENSRHLAMLPLVSPPNDVWETNAEISYWWCITTQVWAVLLIGLNQISHAAQPVRGSTQIWVVTPRHQYGISPLVSQTTFGGETSGSVAKCRPFFRAKQNDEHWNKVLSFKWRKIWVT